MGITTYIPDMSDILKCVGIYGYDNEGTLLGRKLKERLEWLHQQDNERLKLLRQLEGEYRSKREQIQTAMLRLEGAILEWRGQRQTDKAKARLAEMDGEYEERKALIARLDAEYQDKHHKIRDERNQIVGGIQDVTYLMRAWVVPADNAVGGGNIPSAETRAADPRTGISAPSGDNVPKTPAAVPV